MLGAATRLFIERGYTATTVAAVARSADVSPETIYATFDDKRRLLESVIDAAISRTGASLLPEDESRWDAIALQGTARGRLRAYVDFSCGVLKRTSPIHQVIRGAADGEPFAVELSARLLRERLAANTTNLRDFIGDSLRDGLTMRRAAERFCALSSPEMHHLLTFKLGWSPAAHQKWLAEVAEQDLLGPP